MAIHGGVDMWWHCSCSYVEVPGGACHGCHFLSWCLSSKQI